MPSSKHLQHIVDLLNVCCKTWNFGIGMNVSKNTAASSSRISCQTVQWHQEAATAKGRKQKAV